MTSILVLDDRAENRELMTAVLGARYRVTEASSGPQALELARADPPDLVIADIVMPEMDGYEFVRELRRNPRNDDTRVMFCTATYGEGEVRELATACGVSQILFKPCEPEEIHAAVAEALARGHGPEPALTAKDFDEHLRVLNGKLIEKIRQLEESERRGSEALTLLEMLHASAPVGFGFLDREFRTVRANETLAGIHGVPVEEQIGRTMEEAVPHLWPQVEPMCRRVLDSGEPIVNVEVEGSAPGTAERRCWLSSFYPVRLANEVVGIGLVVVDITERQQAEDLRAVVMDNMAEGVIVCDRDGLLSYMNAAATKMLGWREEELLGRPMHAAIHYQRADGSPFPAEECELTAIPTDGLPVRSRDDALTRKDGRIIPVAYSGSPLRTGHAISGSVLVFHDISDEKAEETRERRELDALTWVGRIRDALAEERLVLYAQPIVPLRGGAPSEELLLRMVSRTGDLISPGSFLPAAENYGLIGEIDRWVIDQAIERAAGGRRVEINLSARSLGDLGLLHTIESHFRAASVDPSLLTFEITETALMRNIEAGEEFVKGLVALGSGVALDDFGTGFGSFTYLKRLPIDFLKIDIEFVRDLIVSPHNRHLVRATVGLAHDFGLQTIAEGVEDAETLELLTDLEVDYAQGYFLGRPTPLTSASVASLAATVPRSPGGGGRRRTAARH
jgi:PAS domain S-box-containing protein